MAHTKTAGKARQGTPRRGRRLGIKLSSGSKIKSGEIILRQGGSSFHEGIGTKKGRDFTIYAMKDGLVSFKILKGKKIVEVI